MSDMDDFLGKTVVDSIEGANKFNQQMDGFKLIGQRQINLLQQEQITSNKGYTRELENEISKLKSQIYLLERESKTTNSGPTDGWPQIYEFDNGALHRTQTHEGYQKEVQRLQNEIITLTKSLLFYKTYFFENNRLVQQMSFFTKIPENILQACINLGKIKYYKGNNEKNENYDKLSNNESSYISYFLNKQYKVFDLINYQTEYNNFLTNWLISTFIHNENTIIQYTRENQDKKDNIKKLIEDIFISVNLENPFSLTIKEKSLYVKLKAFIKQYQLVAYHYCKLLNISEKELQELLFDSKKQILNNNLTDREINIYNIQLDEETINLLKNYKSNNLLNKLNNYSEIKNKEEIEEFNYIYSLMRLETRAYKRTISLLAIKYIELNPIKEPDYYERKYRDNDPGRELLEENCNIIELLSEMNNNNEFSEILTNHKEIIIQYLREQVRVEVLEIRNNRDREYHRLVHEEKQKQADDTILLFNNFQEQKETIYQEFLTLDFSKNKLQVSSKIEEFTKLLYDIYPMFYSVKSIYPNLKLNEEELKKLEDLRNFYGAISQNYNLSLVGSKEYNTGSIFNKKLGRDVYLRAEWDISKSKKFGFGNIHKTTLEFKGKSFQMHNNLNNYNESMPLVFYFKLGTYLSDETIDKLEIIIKETDNCYFLKNYILNKDMRFNKKVGTLPEIPKHGLKCAEILEKPDRTKGNFYGFTIEDLNIMSEGLFKFE